MSEGETESEVFLSPTQDTHSDDRRVHRGPDIRVSDSIDNIREGGTGNPNSFIMENSQWMCVLVHLCTYNATY